MLGKKLTTIAAAVLSLIAMGTFAEPAHAATTTRIGKSCTLSANWKINMSVTWYGADMQYAVMTSPGPLNWGPPRSGPVQASTAYAYGPTPPTFNGYFQDVTKAGDSGYTYRANIVGVDNYDEIDLIAVKGPKTNEFHCGQSFQLF